MELTDGSTLMSSNNVSIETEDLRDSSSSKGKPS